MITSLKQRIKLNHNMYKRMILFLMPSLLNTVGKITCYDFTKKCMESRVSKVFIKKEHLVKITGKGCSIIFLKAKGACQQAHLCDDTDK